MWRAAAADGSGGYCRAPVCDSAWRQITLRDNAQIWHVRGLPLVPGVRTRQSLARVRIFDHPDFIPDEAPGAEFVLDYARACHTRRPIVVKVAPEGGGNLLDSAVCPCCSGGTVS